MNIQLLVPMLDEHTFLTGCYNQGEVFELEGAKMRIIICSYLRFPETIRDLAITRCSSVTYLRRVATCKRNNTLLRVRKIENQMYEVASGVGGQS